jgi:hypothetical protein
MRKLVALGLIPFTLLAAAAAGTEVEFTTPVECQNNHGVYRWDVKTDHEVPPDQIADANKVKPSDIAGWPEPRGVITMHTPRSGREKQWFELTGKVKLAKAEADGDIHVQLTDADNENSVNVVVEVPVKQHPGLSPWDGLRTKIFNDWTKTAFPFRVTDSRDLDLVKRPVIRVTGKAFFDATHKGDVANRRKDAGASEVAVWEIHPVMTLEEVQ